jgi:predicted ATP-grasp superfamily ATP-dependent carboligase
VDWTSVFVPARLLSTIDYQGIMDAVKVLNTMFKLDIDTEQLSRMSEVFTRATAARQQQQKRGGLLDRVFSR